jgi:hypothetical protein
MKIDREGNWNSVSKEKSVKGKFLKYEKIGKINRVLNREKTKKNKGFIFRNVK